MKKTFEKKVGSKKIQFTVEVNENAEIIIEAKGVVGKVDYIASTPKIGWHYHITDLNFIKNVIGVNNKEVKLTHESAKDVWEQVQETKKQIKELEKLSAREQYIKGHKNFELSFTDGEYLSGYTIYGEAAEMLIELGLAKSVANWGTLVSDQLVKELGKSFSYNDLIKYANKINEAKEAKEQEQKDAEEREFEEKLALAKDLGQPVEISRITVPCNDPQEECNTDLIIKYVNPAGDIITRRIHTW